MQNQLSLAEKTAQLFMLGYEGEKPGPVLDKFLAAGLGGIIFFRDNFQTMSQAQEVKSLLSRFQGQRAPGSPELFLSLDQEGGQVERLPHTLFPSLVTPRAIGLCQDPQALAEKTYAIMAEHLSALGFNFNYAPTLDVNLEPKNPIIGVRAFADNATDVWKLAKIAKDCFCNACIIPVGKHFPGHGNGTVDSHLNLPNLKFTREELSVFQKAIDDKIPVMLVSHGFYPDLQTDASELGLPASASRTIIQGLLKERCGFSGLIISDDMCMGAITQGKDPIEAAIASLEAGIDMLVYKQSTQTEWDIYQGVLNAVETGRLAPERIEEAYQSVIRLKAEQKKQSEKRSANPASFPAPDVSQWDAAYLDGLSDAVARAAIRVLKKAKPRKSPKSQAGVCLLLHPDRKDITNYRFDQPSSDELPELLKSRGVSNLTALSYPVEVPGQHQAGIAQNISLPEAELASILFISFNPLLQPVQQALFRQVKSLHPNAVLTVISAGTAYDDLIFEGDYTHIALCSYRPPSMRALADWLCEAALEKTNLGDTLVQ